MVDRGGAEQTLEERVLAELLHLRKQSTGVTVDALARSRLICDLLGAGDPYVAYTRLSHEILDSDLDLPVKAAAASLGLLAEGDTHLKRLDAFGDEVGMDQRQVRRYSDRGIRTLARLIATNWPTETVPRLTAAVVRAEQSWELHLATARLLAVEMRPVTVTLLAGSIRKEIAPKWATWDDDAWQQSHTVEPMRIADKGKETSVVIVWRGELWPKHAVSWIGEHADATSESLGSKLMLRIASAATPREEFLWHR